jgi:hypothetical protein
MSVTAVLLQLILASDRLKKRRDVYAVLSLLRERAEHATTKRGATGNLDSNNTIENTKSTPRWTTITDHNEVGISRSQLLLLLGDLHERLNAVFEEIRALPQATARLKARRRRSAVAE